MQKIEDSVSIQTVVFKFEDSVAVHLFTPAIYDFNEIIFFDIIIVFCSEQNELNIFSHNSEYRCFKQT